MTTLAKTNLSTPLKVHCAANAIASEVNYGSATDLSDAFGISRSTFYKLRARTEQVLTEHFESTELPTVVVSESLIKRAVIALRSVAPNSIRAIEDLLPIIYPGISLSYGSIWKICHEAEITATLHNKMEKLDNIKHVALDELFSQGSPVLGGVDLDSGYVFALELKDQRGVDDWCSVLNEAKEKGLDVDVSVQDAAQGISSAVAKVFPNSERRDDCFHVLYILGTITSGLEARAYRRIREEAILNRKLKQAGFDNLKKRQPIAIRLSSLRVKVAAAIKKYDYFNRAIKLVKKSMDFCSPLDMAFRTEEESNRLLQEAALLIEHTDYWDKKRIVTYLKNRIEGLLLSIKSCRERLERLAEKRGDEVVRLATSLVWFHQKLQKETTLTAKNNLLEHLIAAFSMLSSRVGKDDSKEVIAEVVEILNTRYRASSAIESVNASLRPHLYCRKSVSQSYLELYRFYTNRKTKRWGRHKGRSAYEVLTGQPIQDWLSNLGYTLH